MKPLTPVAPHPARRRPVIIPVVHGPEAFDGMRKAGRLAAECLRMLEGMLTPGITTMDLDNAVAAFCDARECESATVGYNGFPAHVCTSVNHVAAHGVPNSRPLCDGDIIKIDVTLKVDGWHGDTCATFPVGDISVKAARLIEATRDAMMHGIGSAGPLKFTGDIGHAISNVIDTVYPDFNVVRELCGHGIGRTFHDLPNILSYGEPGKGTLLVPGMFFTVEPIVVAGRPFVKTLVGGAVVTRDRSLSAQFEHTIGITDSGIEIFTL